MSQKIFSQKRLDARSEGLIHRSVLRVEKDMGRPKTSDRAGHRWPVEKKRFDGTGGPKMFL